jgi:hypothetical protein
VHFFLVPPRAPSLMVSFANVAAARLTDGIERLGRIVRAARGAGPTKRRRTR